jgi:hypothetical protein
VNLGYEIGQGLPSLRRQAESRFTERLKFFTAVESTDPDTFEVATVETSLGTVPGRVKVASFQGQDPEVAGQYPVVSRLEVHVAVGSVNAPPDTFVRVLASTMDPGMVGRVFRVSDRPSMGQVTAWRYPVEEV